MKNRLFALLLVVALVVTVSVFAVGAEETNPFEGQTTKVTAHCAHCDRDVVWAPVPTASNGEQRVWLDAEIADGATTYYSQGITHFYLTADSTLGSAQKANAGETWCFDLNGFTWTRTSWVFFDGQGGTFNVFDSSAAKTGTCVQTGTANTWDTVMQMVGGTFNQYGGNFVHNQAAWAGNGAVAIIYGGTYNMYGGTMTGKTTKYGGAVYSSNGVFNLVDGTITGYATQGGGGIYVHGGTVNMTGGELKNCTTLETVKNADIAYPDDNNASTTTEAGRGGAVYADMGTFNMSGGKITGARASFAGAIAATSNTAGSKVNISGTAEINGYAGEFGGAIGAYGGKYWSNATGSWTTPSYDNKPVVTISGGTITGEAVNGGGGIVIDNGATVNMTGGTLLNCETTKTNAGSEYAYPYSTTDAYNSQAKGRGGAVSVLHGTFTMNAGTITGAKASYGGAIAVGSTAYGDGNATIGGTALIENCSASGFGGAAIVYGGTKFGTAAEGYARKPHGTYGNLTITGGTFQNCTTNNNAAGVFAGAYSKLNISDGLFQNMTSTYGGAGIYLQTGSAATITGGTVKNCTATSSSTGGMLIAVNATVSVKGMTFENCKGTGSGSVGGNVQVQAGNTVTFEDCKFIGTGDLATPQAAYGGNIYIASNANVTLIDCEIKDGAATTAGGNIHLDGTSGAANVTLTNCTVSGGKAGSEGGNINAYKSNVTLNGNTVINGKGTSSAWAGHNIRMYGGTGTLTIEDATVEECPKGGVSVAIEPGNKVALAGNANVDFLLVRYNTSTGAMPTGAMTVKEGYTGKVWVAVDLDSLNATFEPGTEIGDWMAQDGYENTGVIYIEHIDGGWVNGEYTARPVADIGDTFKVATMTAVKDGVETGLAAMPEGGDYDYIKLYAGGDITLTEDTTVRLNGQSANFINGDHKLSVFDTATDDGTTAGTSFTVSNPENLERYAQNVSNGYQYVIVEKNGEFTSNRVQVTLDYIAIKPSQTGIYYITTIKTNAAVKDQVKYYGTAVSLGQKEIDENFLNDPAVMYTEFGPEKIETDDKGNISMRTNSALIYGILTEGDENNARNAGMKIKANSYIVVNLGNGQEKIIMADESFKYSLNDAMGMLDDALDTMGDKKASAVKFYTDWQSVFADVQLPNLQAAAAEVA